jgi:hypothetical protein
MTWDVHHVAIALEASMREEAVVNFFAKKGYAVLSTSDAETRRLFKMSSTAPAADIVVEVTKARLIIAEVKGSDIEHALRQLRSTAEFAKGKYVCIDCKIFVRNQTPHGDSVDIRGGHCGYRCVRIFRAGFPGEWVLYEYDEKGNTQLVRAGTENVTVVFGPHVC